MFKFAIIFVIGLLIIPYIHSQETILTTDAALLTTQITSTTITSLLTLPESSTVKDATTTVLDIQTNSLYGLISLNSSESSKTIIDSIDYNPTLRDSVGEQCLRFYYYFTIYDEENWGQQIQAWIRPNNQSDNAFLIGTLTIDDMEKNGWELQKITFNSTFSNYTARSFSFIVGKENRTEDSTSNRTVYFALDDIELYDFNCPYVDDHLNPPTTTTSTPNVGVTPPPSKTGLTVGLILGLGIPGLIGIIIGGLYLKKRRDAYRLESFDVPMLSRGLRAAANRV
ncbi:unnamed protein product [Rotaria sordida]|uniref:MAM domain-containing protein n=1 Tax=Rotaria sordida TaxID=392033 RepID=A0A815P720_9BILA|nr:unnamed protein product [Rotaria sordida]CAF1636995.1 unnamed protein product [Rotaria sordida]